MNTKRPKTIEKIEKEDTTTSAPDINQSSNKTKDFEQTLQDSKKSIYILKLYITGMTPKSKQAIENITKICNTHLENRYELEVIDIYQNPSLLKGEQIIAVPTLIKKLPSPIRKIIGDLSDIEKVLVGLDIINK
ncbi:MAG: circadian clock KaiB family protein [Oligoflexia bacterium]|nr:circadian clock KaiB family protein [Oligoflexia bacterium]